MKRSLALTALIGLTITGCGTAEAEPLNMDSEACYDIAQYIQDGAPRETRVETITDVGGYIGNADPRLQEAHEGLVRTMEGPESAFTLALDVYASVCLDDLKWDGER